MHYLSLAAPLLLAVASEISRLKAQDSRCVAGLPGPDGIGRPAAIPDSSSETVDARQICDSLKIVRELLGRKGLAMGPLDDNRQAARLNTVHEHINRENAHDLDGVLATFGSSASYHEQAWDDHYVGREEVRAYYEQLFRASADLDIDVRKQYVTSEAVILEVVLSGTHTGSWRGLTATGRQFRLPLCAIYTFDENDRLAGERIYYDRATLLNQLGVLHEPDSFVGRVSTLVMHPLTTAQAIGRKLTRQAR